MASGRVSVTHTPVTLEGGVFAEICETAQDYRADFVMTTPSTLRNRPRRCHCGKVACTSRITNELGSHGLVAWPQVHEWIPPNRLATESRLFTKKQVYIHFVCALNHPHERHFATVGQRQNAKKQGPNSPQKLTTMHA